MGIDVPDASDMCRLLVALREHASRVGSYQSTTSTTRIESWIDHVLDVLHDADRLILVLAPHV